MLLAIASLVRSCIRTMVERSGPLVEVAGRRASGSPQPQGPGKRVLDHPRQDELHPGTYTFTIQNQGSFPHNLTIKGPGVGTKASPTLAGGRAGSLTVALQKGSYELWCSVPGHKHQGMDITIKVD